MIELETERMLLRSLAREDIDGVHEIFRDPVAMRFSITGVRDISGTSEWLETAIGRAERDGHGFWAALLKETGSYAGHAGLLRQQVDGRDEVEVAYWFQRRFWNRGLATEAACACRDHGFDVLGRDRLISLIVPENLASRRVAEKVGMSLERETIWKSTRVCVYALARPRHTK